MRDVQRPCLACDRGKRADMCGRTDRAGFEGGNRNVERRIFCQAIAGTLVGAAAGLAPMRHARACTRVLWNSNKLAVIVGRTMDWPKSTDPILTVLPRGMKRDGGLVGPHVAVPDNPLRWTSRYGSLVTTTYGIGSADGLNEHGLAAHMLYLNATEYGPRDTSKPGLQAGLWAQYALDTAATVSDALAALLSIQPVMVEEQGDKATLHLAMEDAGGDSAVIEYIEGRPVVHHGREYRVMTNDPPYDQQLALLKKHDFSRPSRDTPLPGNVNPSDRFIRASYYESMLPEPTSEREAIAAMFSVMANVSVPFGAPYKDFGIYNTEYRSVSDLTNKIYYFQLTTSPSVIWADLSKFDLSPNAPVRMLDPDNIGLSGNVTARFTTGKAPF